MRHDRECDTLVRDERAQGGGILLGLGETDTPATTASAPPTSGRQGTRERGDLRKDGLVRAYPRALRSSRVSGAAHDARLHGGLADVDPQDDAGSGEISVRHGSVVDPDVDAGGSPVVDALGEVFRHPTQPWLIVCPQLSCQ